MVFRSEALVSSKSHISELLIRVLIDRCSCSAVRFSGSEGWLYAYMMTFLAYGQHTYKCECCEVIVVRICSSSNNYVLGMCQNPNLSDKIFDC